MSTPPPLDPAAAATVLTGLAPRLLRRAQALAAAATGWRITAAGETVTVEVGGSLVSVDAAGTPTCGCLLAPRCAHLAAVCLAAATPVPAPPPAQPAPPPAAGRVPPAGRTAAVLDALDPVIEEILAHGLIGLSTAGHTRLLAGVQAARTHGLIRLDRELTALAATSRALRRGEPTGRTAPARQLQDILLTRHLLRRDPGDRAALGTARRGHRALAAGAGAGAGVFTPLCAEPVLTDSGFAGITLTLLSGADEPFHLTRAPAGAAADVHRIWHGPVRLGDIHCSHAALSERTLLLTGATSSHDNRLGAPRGARAAQGAPVTLETLRHRRLPPELAFLRATLAAARPTGVTTRDSHRFTFLPAARILGVTGLTDTLTAALTAGEVTLDLLVRDGHMLALWATGPGLNPARRILPGLDKVHPPRRAGAAPDPDTAHRSVAEILWPWPQRLVTQGAPAILRRRTELIRDVARLRELAAPTAARLLDELGHRPRQAQALLSVGVYLAAVEHR